MNRMGSLSHDRIKDIQLYVMHCSYDILYFTMGSNLTFFYVAMGSGQATVALQRAIKDELVSRYFFLRYQARQQKAFGLTRGSAHLVLR